MTTLPARRTFPTRSRNGFLSDACRSSRSARAGLACATGLLALVGLAGCDGGGDTSPTGISAPPALNVIPTQNTSSLEVRIRNPRDGGSVSGTVTIEVEVREKDVRRSRGEIFIGSERVASSTAERFSYSWNTANHPGKQTITAVGWDVDGNSALSSISVTAPGSSTSSADSSTSSSGDRIVTAVTLNPDSIVAGGTSTGTVILDGPAPAGGTAVSLVSNRTGVATVPASTTVPEGETGTTFTVTGQAVASADWSAISANAGGVTETAVLWVLPAGVTAQSLSLEPTIVASGETAVGTVQLSGPAPESGASVELSSSDTTRATVAASVTLAAGATTATFPVTAETVASNVAVTIAASYGGVTATARLTVTPPAPSAGQLASLTISPDLVVGGETAQGTVTLGAASGSGTQVTLTSTDPAVASVPPSVTVPAGATSAVFTITTGVNTSGQGQFAEISGEAGGVTRSATITTVGQPSGPAMNAVQLFPSRVGGGGPVTGIVSFDGSLADGVILEFTSSHPDIVQVPDRGVQVIWTSTQRAFPITTGPVSANTDVTITATACCGGVGEATATLTVTTDAPPPPDVVEVQNARWIPGGRGGTLQVRARSTSSTAILTVFRAGTDIKLLVLRPVGGGRYEGEQSFGGGATNPGTIDVRSNLGGTVTARVRQ